MIAFLLKIAGFFNTNDIPYMLSGSVAMSMYTLPRATRDFDFVVHLNTTDAETNDRNYIMNWIKNLKLNTFNLI